MPQLEVYKQLLGALLLLQQLLLQLPLVLTKLRECVLR